MSQVEDWKVTIPSVDLVPTVPLTFDEVYWEAYWKIVNKPASVVRDVMIKLERETGEKEKMAMKNRNSSRMTETAREDCTEEEKKNH